MHKIKIFLLVVVCASLAVCRSEASFAGEEATEQQQQQNVQLTPAEAFILFSNEAEKGNAAAMLTLGNWYERGVGTPRNFIKAFEWYQKAALAGLPEGYYNVGVAYEEGMGNAGDPKKAFEAFEKSAELGLHQGLYKLAMLYFTGTGVSKNEAWGLELLNRAADAGNMAAANDLGMVYFQGLYGQGQDYKKAIEMFQRAANLGNAEAMKNLAVFHRDGLGVEKDQAEELKWYLLASRAGFPIQPLKRAMDEIAGSIGEEKRAEVEKSVEAWIVDFQQRQQAQQQQQAQQRQ